MVLTKQQKVMLLALAGLGIVTLSFVVLAPMLGSLAEANQKKTQLDSTLSGLKNSITQINSDIAHYQQKLNEPLTANIQRFRANEQAYASKLLVAKLLKQLSSAGAELISLVPYEAEAPQIELDIPPTVLAPTEATAGTDPNMAIVQPTPAADGTVPPAPTDPNAPAQAPQKEAPAIPVMAEGYEFQARGTYKQVLQFIQNLKANPEAVEIQALQILNESGPIRDTADTTVVSAGSDGTGVSRKSEDRPIKIVAKVRVFLMPESVS